MSQQLCQQSNRPACATNGSLPNLMVSHRFSCRSHCQSGKAAVCPHQTLPVALRKMEAALTTLPGAPPHVLAAPHASSLEYTSPRSRQMGDADRGDALVWLECNTLEDTRTKRQLYKTSVRLAPVRQRCLQCLPHIRCTLDERVFTDPSGAWLLHPWSCVHTSALLRAQCDDATSCT